MKRANIVKRSQVLVDVDGDRCAGRKVGSSGQLSIGLIDHRVLPGTSCIKDMDNTAISGSRIFTCRVNRGNAPIVSTSPLAVRYRIMSVCRARNFSGFVYTVIGACTTPRILSGGKGLSCAGLGPMLFRFPACSCLTAKRVVNGYLGLSGQPNVYTGRPVDTSNVIQLSGVRICPRCLSRCVGCTARMNRVSLHARSNILAVCTINRGRGPYGIAVLRACTDRTTCMGRVTSRRFRGCGRKALHVIGSLILSSRAPLGPTGGLGGFVRWVRQL